MLSRLYKLYMTKQTVNYIDSVFKRTVSELCRVRLTFDEYSPSPQQDLSSSDFISFQVDSAIG
jgi:hypothetical protein